MAAGHEEKLEAVTENIANATTPGYRKLVVAHRVFETALANASASANSRIMPETYYDPSVVDFTQGAVRQTGRTLDFAIRGPGFFVVTNEGRDLYTRKGDFKLNPDGALVNADGMQVQGVTGPVRIPPQTSINSITCDDAGNLRAGGSEVIARLKIAVFDNPHRLARTGTTLFMAPDDVNPKDSDADTSILNGALETANTTIFQEIADLVTLMRNYEACQRMIRNSDDNTGRMIQQYSP